MSQSTASSSRLLPAAAGTAGSVLALALAGTALAAPPACDDRVSITDPARFPFNTICELTWPADTPGFISVGTGFLVSPYTVLTNGHCVYNRDAGAWISKPQTIAPAAFRNGGVMVNPYGTRLADIKATNTKWTDPEWDAPVDVDYGSMRIICPFEELTTFMPLRFDYVPSFINMSGYPTADLPPTGDSRDQWRGADDVTEVLSRRMTYDQRSTGGASGSPVWIYNAETQERYVVAINRGHNTDCNGLGPRLVDNNEAIIREWMTWEPTLQQKAEAGCAFELVPVPWTLLLNQLVEQQQWLTPVEALRLVEPIVPPPAPPAARMMQVIEGTFYEWLEFTPDPSDPTAPRFLRMVSPEPQWLTVLQAQVLLSASARLIEEVPFGPNTTQGPVEPAIGLPELVAFDPVDLGDPTVDFPVLGPLPGSCPADVNGDGVVDFNDLILVLSVFGAVPGQPGVPLVADVDADGVISFGDVLGILAAWGPCDG